MADVGGLAWCVPLMLPLPTARLSVSYYFTVRPFAVSSRTGGGANERVTKSVVFFLVLELFAIIL